MATVKPITTGWSIVMIGHWNRMVFTPAWVSGRLTPAEQLLIEVPVDNPANPIRFSFDDIMFEVSSRRLIFTPKRAEDVLLERMVVAARKILNDLPHTPLQGVGVNFLFEVEGGDSRLAQPFSLSDNGWLSDFGAEIESTSIKRRLKLAGDQILNLSLEFAAPKLTAQFNFHKDTPSCGDAQTFLQTNPISFKSTALNLLDTVYQTPFEELTEHAAAV